jgi:hypothetical protein
VQCGRISSPMHLKYTTHMSGMDITDQLWASYSMQNCTHKWWHKIIFFPLGYDGGKYVI